jgi:hypothetical protein
VPPLVPALPALPALPPLPPPPVLPPVPVAPQPAAPGASHGRVKVQKKLRHCAPIALHLQSSVVVHQPSWPLGDVPAGLHTSWPVLQSQMSPPHWGVATQSSSLTQFAGLLCAAAVPAADRATSAVNNISFVRFDKRVMGVLRESVADTLSGSHLRREGPRAARGDTRRSTVGG